MKGSHVLFVLVVAVVAATQMHLHKKSEQGDRITKLAAGLEEVERFLPPNTSLTLKIPEVAPPESYMQWRFLLAPRYCSIQPKEHFDTVLALLNTNASDSAQHSVTDGRRIISYSTDGQYKYYLTCNNK